MLIIVKKIINVDVLGWGHYYVIHDFNVHEIAYVCLDTVTVIAFNNYFDHSSRAKTSFIGNHTGAVLNSFSVFHRKSKQNTILSP